MNACGNLHEGDAYGIALFCDQQDRNVQNFHPVVRVTFPEA